MAGTTRTLIFSTEKQDGALPVTDEYGRVLARISSPGNSAHFNVTAPDGRTLCHASASWWGLGTWTVIDDDEQSMLSVTANLLRSRAVVHLDRHGDLVLEGKGSGGDLTLRDADGRSLVEAAPASATRTADGRRGSVVLVHLPEAIRLAEVVAVVHIWRLVKKAAVTSSAALSSSVARGA